MKTSLFVSSIIALFITQLSLHAENAPINILWHNSTNGAVKMMPIDGMASAGDIDVVTSSNTNLVPRGMGDFTREGNPDILLHNQNSGNLRIWKMNGVVKLDNILVLGSSNTNLMIAGVGDFDLDGDSDVAVFNTNSGALRIWVMNGTIRVGNILVLTGANTNLIPSSAGDMDGDGIPDLVLRNDNTGTVRVWTMNSDFSRKGNEHVTDSSNTNLELRGVVDINGDGNNDILNYNTNTGMLRAWIMDGHLQIIGNVSIVQESDLDWSVRGGYSIASNVAPIANAGSIQNIPTSSTVTLDGSKSSDADGDALTYQWSITSKPSDSNAALSDATSVRPSFVADVDGSYVIELIVNDGTFNGAVATVTITASTVNSAPVARAGVDLSVKIQIGATIGLNGEMSSDADGDLITYQWTLLSKPTGSNTILIDANSVTPTFVPDTDGVYVFELIVNDGTVDSAADVMTVTVTSYIPNSAPVADAGDDQNIKTTSTVTLDGSASFDVNLDTLTYSWSMTSKPTNSNAQLSNATVVNPTFAADLDGIYVIQLIVNDGNLSSTLDTVIITAATENSAPVADAGVDQIVNISSIVRLDGSASHDANKDTLAYEWLMVSKPEESLAILRNDTAPDPTFIADLRGDFVIGLRVMDKYFRSEWVTARITAVREKTLGTDSSFDGDGIVVHPNAAGGNGWDEGNAIALDSAGNIYVLGSSANADGNREMVIWKYTNNGNLVTSFGNGDDLGNTDLGNAIALDSTGNIYVTGITDNYNAVASMVIWKFRSDGTLDPMLNGNGIAVYSDVSGGKNIGNSIALDNGNIYVTGSSTETWSSSEDMAVWKFKSDGSPDHTFGKGGMVVNNYAPQFADFPWDEGNAIALSAGNIYVAGASKDSSFNPSSDMVIWKYNSLGEPDNTFNEDGIVSYDGKPDYEEPGVSYSDVGNAIALDSAGNVYVTGYVFTYGHPDMAIWKYKSDGNPDLMFGNAGVAVYNNKYSGPYWNDKGYVDVGNSIALDSARNIYVVGYSVNADGNKDMVIWKYGSNGTISTLLGGDGKIVDNSAAGGDGNDEGKAIVLDGAENVYVTGSSVNTDGNSDMVIWKYKPIFPRY